MANKAKLINMAQKAMAKGQWDKAVSFLEKILAEEPGDVRTMLRLGDVCAKKGDRPRAVDVYRRVATHHAEQGFFLKAVAVYKQILKLDPTNGEAALRIAELHEQLGLAQDAMVHFQLALPVLEEQGQHDQVVEVLARILELDGENVAARIKLAETLSRLDRRGDAVEHFAQAARILKQQARIEDYVKVAERLIFHDSSRLDLVKDLAKLYLSRGDTKRGLAKLQICFRETPRDVETLTLLAKAFDDLGQVLKTVYVYRELARVHAEEGRADEAREIHRLILQHVPDEAESLRALGLDAPSAPSPRSPRSSLEFEAPVDLAAHSGDVNMTGALPINASRDLREPTVEPPIETPFLGETSPTPSLHDEPTDAGPRSRYPELATGDLLVDAELQGSSLPPPPEQSPLSDEMEQIISEAEVYISYNLPSRAIEHLRRALALDPASPPVYRRLHDAYAAMGDSDRAAEAMANVLTLYLNAGDSSRADEARLALQALDPQHPTLHGAQPRQADQFAAGEPEPISVDIDQTGSQDVPNLSGAEDIAIDTGEFHVVEEQGPPSPPWMPPGTPDFSTFKPEEAAAALGAPAGSRDLGDLDDSEPVSEAAMEVEPDQLEAAELEPEFLDALPAQSTSSPLPAPPPPPGPDQDRVSNFHDMPSYVGFEPSAAPTTPPRAGPESDDLDLADAVAALERTATGVGGRLRATPPPPKRPPARSPSPPPWRDATTEPPVVSDVFLGTDAEEAQILEAISEVDEATSPTVTPPDVASVEPLLPPDTDDFALEAANVPEPLPVADEEPLDLGPEENLDAAPASAPRATAIPLSAETPASIEDELEELDFFLDADLFDEADEALAELERTHASHPLVIAARDRLNAKRRTDGDSGPIELLEVVPSSSPANPLPEEDEVLAFLDGAAPAAPEVTNELYDQGMAYKQIGQLEDAAEAFRAAARSSPHDAANALEMLGHCLVESQRFDEALGAYEAALEAASDPASIANLHYELGATLEQVGDLPAAREAFEACQAVLPDHRDVQHRLEGLDADDLEPPESIGGEAPALPPKRSKISYR